MIAGGCKTVLIVCLSYAIGVIAGIFLLPHLFWRLGHGLNDVFEHAKRMIFYHVFSLAMYVILGSIWGVLILYGMKNISNFSIITTVIIGTSALVSIAWFFQKMLKNVWYSKYALLSI